jgi:hypothetical protein
VSLPQRLTEALAAHLAQIVRYSAHAGKEEGESGKIERKQFKHGRMHNTSGPGGS